MLPLKERWKVFAIVVFDPWAILLLICTIFLSMVLIRQDDLVITSVLTFLVSLFSGVLGGIFSKRWDDLSEEKVIVARAKSATRSLELLLSSIVSLERRVGPYIERHNDLKRKKQITSEVVKTYFEEMMENCLELEEKVVNSIEDWKDILPNIEVKTVLHLIRELKVKYGNAVTQLDQINKNLQETKDISQEEVAKLEAEKKDLKKELLKIQQELREKSLQVGVPTISGSLITGSYDAYTPDGLYAVVEDGNVVLRSGFAVNVEAEPTTLYAEKFLRQLNQKSKDKANK